MATPAGTSSCFAVGILHDHTAAFVVARAMNHGPCGAHPGKPTTPAFGIQHAQLLGLVLQVCQGSENQFHGGPLLRCHGPAGLY